MQARKKGLIGALAFAVLILVPSAAQAANIAVTTTTDESTDNATCSLREAIKSAETNSNAHEMECTQGQAADDSVNLQATPVTPYAIAGTGDDTNVAGDFDLNVPAVNGGFLIINGVLGANDVPTSVIDANDLDRIFDIREGGTSSVRIQNVILQDGSVPGGSEDGGAIRVDDDDSQFELNTSRVESSHAGRYGGGLSIDDAADGIDARIVQTEFSGNTSGDDGGALYVDVPEDYPVVVQRSAFVGNSSMTMGGAAYIESPGSAASGPPLLTFTNSTLSGNSAVTGGGAIAFDFGQEGTVYIRFTTIANNSTPLAAGGGGVFTNDIDQYVLFQGGVIISGNSAADAASNCAGPGNEDSLGYNIESTNACGLDQGTDLINTDPLLAPLALNTGGDLTTRTHGPYNESPAVNRIPSGSCTGATGEDQRDVGRPVPIGGNCDVGAFEGSVGPFPTNPVVPVTPITPTTAAPAPAPQKKCKKKRKRGAAAAKKKCKKKKK